MKTSWFKGHADKEQRKKQVKGYKNAFSDLKEILNRDYKKQEAVRDYGDPNWMYRQIAVNEYNRVLEDIINLISIED